MNILFSISPQQRLNRWQQTNITPDDLQIFFRQLSTLLTAHLSVSTSLQLLAASFTHPALCDLISSIQRQIESGRLFSDCLHEHRRYFDKLSYHLIKIGEQTGKLDITTSLLADFLEKRLALRKRIKQILFYPCLICCTAMGLTIGMFLVVIPHFADLFAPVIDKLPVLTRCLFFMSSTLAQHSILTIIMLFSTVTLSIFCLRSKKTKEHLYRVITVIPAIHHTAQKAEMAAFSRHLAMTYAAGIPILDGLALLLDTTANNASYQFVSALHDQISAGTSLYAAARMHKHLPPLLVQMIHIGEESGMLDTMLNKTAELLETDVEAKLYRFSQLLEPLIMLLLGALIGGLVVGMYLPIFQLGSTL